MSRFLLAIALVGIMSSVANADFRTVNRAYEAQLSGIRLPASVNGRIAFRQCADCKPLSLPVSASTRYVINKEDVTLREFRRQVLQVRERQGRAVIVKHDIESDVVIAVSIRL